MIGTRSFLILISSLLLLKTGLAQHLQPTGEENLFKTRRQKFNICTGVELNVSQTSEYYSKVLYSTVDNELLQAGLAIKGHFPISNNFALRFRFPYLAKLGFIKDPRFPGYGFEVNNGMGDFTTDVSIDILGKKGSTVDWIAQFGLLIPTGQSRFDESFKGFLPLGNGFRSLTFGSGLSGRLSKKTVLFGNGGIVFRDSRTFKSGDGFFSDEIKLNPDNIQFFGGGVGILVQRYKQDFVILNLEFERISVGELKRVITPTSRSVIEESGLNVSRFGVKVSQISAEGEPRIVIYFGVEMRESADEAGSFNEGRVSKFITNVSLPLAFKIFCINF